ncbi:hypothetical protein Tco_0690986 [Tanacetum coccineum]
MTKAITDFGAGTVTIYPDIDPFLEETEEEEKSNDDWDRLLDFNIDDLPLLGEGLPSFVCKIGKSSSNKKWTMENLNFFYQDIGTSSSVGGHLTQEEVAKEAIAIGISQNFALLEEERPIIETMAYHDKYKKILDEVWKDKLGREDIKKVYRGITMINHTQAEATGILTNVLCQTIGTHDDKAGSSRSKRSRQHETVEELLLLQVHHEFLLWEGCNRDAKSRNPILRVIHKMITYGLCQRTTGYDKVQKNDLWLLSMFDARHQNGDLDTITLRDLIDSEGRLIPEDPQPGVPRVGIPRPPRASFRTCMIGWGAYNPPGYAQPQYDQYYQQYPPLPPQYPP